MFLPLSTVHDYVDFRQFPHDMRERIQRQGNGSSTAKPDSHLLHFFYFVCCPRYSSG